MRAIDILSLIDTLDEPAFLPGGCAANTACGLGAMGVPTAFVGMTGDDGYARIFEDGLAPYNVVFHGSKHPERRTTLCLTLVTQDKERSFVFSPDAASWSLPEDALPDHHPGSRLIVYTEANLLRMTSGTQEQSMLHAVVKKYADPSIIRILNLIDTEITAHQRQTIHDLITHKKFDFIISNVDELKALFNVPDAEDALQSARLLSQNFVTTLGRDGAAVISGGDIVRIDPIFVAHEDIQDLIGAGDQFAAGFIAGIARGQPIVDACRLGALKASEILLVPGARPIPAKQ